MTTRRKAGSKEGRVSGRTSGGTNGRQAVNIGNKKEGRKGTCRQDKEILYRQEGRQEGLTRRKEGRV